MPILLLLRYLKAAVTMRFKNIIKTTEKLLVLCSREYSNRMKHLHMGSGSFYIVGDQFLIQYIIISDRIVFYERMTRSR